MTQRSSSEAAARAGQLKVTQVRSVINRPKDQKATVRRLGLHRINDSVLKDDRPEIRGMIAKVRHLVRVEEVAGGDTKRAGGSTKETTGTTRASASKGTSAGATRSAGAGRKTS